MNALDFSHEATPETVGMKPEVVAALGRLFEDQILRQGLHPAAQLVVLRRGKVVLDRALGVGRFASVQKDTPFLAFSVTKPFTGLCVLKLAEENCLELGAPIVRYWPEFGRKGKESATVRHALLHQAGIPAPHLYRQIPLWPFWGAVTRNVANTEAVFLPGSQVAYHLVNFGFILGEVVRRVSGLPVNVYLKRSFLEPLGLDHTTMRLPWRSLAATPALVAEAKALKNTVRVFNLPLIRTSLMPAASLHSTARELAIFYQMLLDGGAYMGQRCLKPETIKAATSPSYEGWDS
jgi:CubicO group peptidase (beta-lactamase class C family)